MTDKSLLLNEIRDALMDCDLFNNFPPTDIQAAARYFGLTELKKGETIFSEGDMGTFMCIVSDGDISVLKSNLEGKKVTLAKLHTGRTFGEMALLDGERRSATCVAATDCVLLTLSQDSLEKMLDEAPRTAANVIRAVAVALSKRLRMADGKLVDMQV
jgi:CRP/FNR family transcriptional regulator, cyclic AMP receptor protein